MIKDKLTAFRYDLKTEEKVIFIINKYKNYKNIDVDNISALIRQLINEKYNYLTSQEELINNNNYNNLNKLNENDKDKLIKESLKKLEEYKEKVRK